MKKEELKRLKSALLAGVIYVNLCACQKTEETKEDEKNTKTSIEEFKYNVVISFIEGKAIIYDPAVISVLIKNGNVQIGTPLDRTIYIEQSPCVVIPGIENAIEYASGIVGEENIKFVSFNETENKLIYQEQSEFVLKRIPQKNTGNKKQKKEDD